MQNNQNILHYNNKKFISKSIAIKLEAERQNIYTKKIKQQVKIVPKKSSLNRLNVNLQMF